MKNSETISGQESASAPIKDQTSSSRRILVADDDVDILHLNTEVLTDFGYRVDAAEDGVVAWDALQLNRYDLLITDHNMPKLSGFELLKKLRAARMALPVILVSGAIPSEELDLHPGVQIEAILLKPYSFPELLGTVIKVLTASDDARVQIAPPSNWKSQPLSHRLQI